MKLSNLAAVFAIATSVNSQVVKNRATSNNLASIKRDETIAFDIANHEDSAEKINSKLIRKRDDDESGTSDDETSGTSDDGESDTSDDGESDTTDDGESDTTDDGESDTSDDESDDSDDESQRGKKINGDKCDGYC